MTRYIPKHLPTKKYNRLKMLAFAFSGSAQTFFIVFFCCLFVAGGGYVYSVNRSAVQGYEMRTLEKKLQDLKKQNVVLRLEAAEAGSLARVEAGSIELRMEKASPSVLSPSAPIAYR